MGCPELSIESYFRITRPDASPPPRPNDACTQKTAYSRFSQPVVSNYRYYSPQLGRWLSRDPLYERGSTAWFRFNREDGIRAIIEKIDSVLRKFDELILFNKESQP